jgi:hypothetical protein
MAAKSKHVRRFLTAADHRLQDADYLRRVDRTLGAAYLAGYAVEFVLKALVLALLDEHEQPKMIAQFRGTKAHDYNWLRFVYRANGGANLPKAVIEAFMILDAWRTDLRYNPRSRYSGDVDRFFQAVDTVLDWAKARL